MKKILILTCFTLLVALAINAQTAEVTFTNSSATYFGGVFFTSGITGCPSSPLSVANHDIPNDGVSRDETPINENGNNISSVSTITGITLQDVTGSTGFYFVTFCQSGTPQLQGTGIVPIASTSLPFTIVAWDIDTSTNTILISIF